VSGAAAKERPPQGDITVTRLSPALKAELRALLARMLVEDVRAYPTCPQEDGGTSAVAVDRYNRKEEA
jgi:hypothetical protein